MGFQSQSGQVGFKTQTTAGVYDNPGTAGVFMRTRSGSLGPNRDLLVPDPEIGGGRDVPDAYLGAVSWSGEYDFYARSRAVATLLRAALGSATSVATLPSHAHTITPIDIGSLPYLSVEEAVGDGFEVFNFTDAKVNTFHLEAEANGYLMGTVGLVARQQVAGATRTAVPAVDTNPMFVGTNISVTYNAVTLPAKTFSLDVNNNLEDDDFRLGSFFLNDMTEKRRELTMGVTIRPQNSALWRQALYGVAAATQPGGLTTKQQAVITMETYEVIGASAVKHKIQVTVPKAIFEPLAVEPSGDDIIELDFALRALRPDPTTAIATFVVVNDQAAIA